MARSDRRALIAFFLLALALSWAVWGTALAEQHGLLTWHLPGDPLSYLAVTVAAVLVTVGAGGRHGLTELLRRLVLGPLWAAWHIPLFLLAGSRQSYPFVGFLVLAVSITVVMTWLFDRTGGSILLAAIVHAAMNTWWAATNALWGDATLFWLLVAATATLAAALAVLQSRSRHRTAQPQLVPAASR